MVFSSAATGSSKPDTGIFRAALARLDVPASGRCMWATRRPPTRWAQASRHRRAHHRSRRHLRFPAHRYHRIADRDPGADHLTRHKPATSAVHAGRHEQTRRRHRQRAVVTPVHREAMTEFATAADFTKVMADSSRGYLYSRIRNPNSDELAAAVAELEGAEAAHCFASGMAAIAAALDLLAPAGTRVVAPRQLYGQTYALLRRRGDSAFCDITDLDAIARALDGAGLLYVETIANPQIDVADLPALAALARQAGAACWWTTPWRHPLGCRPLEHGADLVAHSATKYLNGHSDALAGVVAGNAELMAQIAARALDTGATISPDTAYLVRRGMRTLDLRLERASANALTIAHMLAEHPNVTRVRLPRPGHDRAHEVSVRVLNSHGALVGIRRRRRRARSRRDRWTPAGCACGRPAWAASRPPSPTPPPPATCQLDEAELAAAGLTPGTLRLSVGIEHPDDLVADLDAALRA